MYCAFLDSDAKEKRVKKPRKTNDISDGCTRLADTRVNVCAYIPCVEDLS